MKIVVISLNGVSLEQMIGDERLTHIRWLMETGCYGKISNQVQSVSHATRAISNQIAHAGKHIRTVHVSPASRQSFQKAQDLVESDDCLCVQISVNGLTTIQRLDTELGNLFESLDNNTAVLVILEYEAHSGFMLVAPNNPLRGEIKDVNVIDLAPTLLGLEGDTIPGWLLGKSLLGDEPMGITEDLGYSQDEEKIVRERLQGLGYI